MQNFKTLFLFLSLILFKISYGQDCNPQKHVFIPGEQIEYDIYYNWGFIWVEAGKVTFTVNKVNLSGKEMYLFKGTGTSLPKHDWFFKVRDYLKSYTEINSFKPVKFNRNTSEGGYKVNNTYVFDKNNTIAYSFTENSDQKFKIDTLALPECTFDMLSAVYYVRNINYSQLSINDTVPVKMIIDNEVHRLYIRYLGKESIEDKSGRIFDCIKFSALLVEGTIFKGGEDMFVWVTEDKNKIPIKVTANILVGSIKTYFNKAENLKYPIKNKKGNE